MHDGADLLEHAVGDQLIERNYEFFGQPRLDPHGSPIPSPAAIANRYTRSTMTQRDDEHDRAGLVARAADGDADALQRLIVVYHPQLRAAVAAAMPVALGRHLDPDDVLPLLILINWPILAPAMSDGSADKSQVGTLWSL